MNVDLGSLKTDMPRRFQGAAPGPTAEAGGVTLTVFFEVLTILAVSKKACWHNGRVLARRFVCCRLIHISCILTIELQRVRLLEHCGPLPNLPNYSPPTARAAAPPSRMQHADGAKYPLCKHATLAKRRCCVAPAPAGVAPKSVSSAVQLLSVYTCRASGGTVSLQHGACEAWHGGARTSKPSARRHFL